jgi:hypothetical protein
MGYICLRGHAVALLFEVLCYKREDRGFESRSDHCIFSIYIILLAALGPGIHSALGSRARPALKAENLTTV